MTSNLITKLAVATLLAAGVQAQEKVELKDAKQKASYAIGMDIGANFKRQDLDVDPKALAAGIADTMLGKTQLTDAEAKQVMNDFRTQLMAKMEAKQKTDTDKNAKEGEVFLAANAKKAGVKTTASGLQYKVLKPGDGKGRAPKSTDTVKVHYHGTLTDGSVFDSSIERGEPATFSGRSGDSRLDGSAPTHERGRQVAGLYSRQAGLRRAQPEPEDRTEQHPHF